MFQELFSLADARACVWASNLAYGSAHEIETDTCHVCLHDGVILDRRVFLVSFRGTQSVLDMITDLRFWRRGHVHEGFCDSYMPVKFRLHELFSSIQKDIPFLICGHSLGGAQARLAAHDFAPMFPNYKATYTFGEPRGGDSQYATETAKRIGDTHFRFVNQEDIIPRVPGCLPFPFVGGYRHTGREIFIPSEGGYCVNPPIIKKLKSDLQGIALELRSGKLAITNDHHISIYSSNVSAL